MKVAIVIPCYKVKTQIMSVINKIDLDLYWVYIVDDKCPEKTGEFVENTYSNNRITVIYNNKNMGVGGAVMSGYKAAINDGADIIVKLDGDGQMDPSLISRFIAPIVERRADYTKGNRFYDLANIGRMPIKRIFGNAMLSFMTKFSSGYWDVFDPTNGYTAIHARVAKHLPFEKISKRYFFETDMLFRLNTLRAVVLDIPMDAVYGDEKSNLKINKIIFEFFVKHIRNSFKRIFYNYFLRDFSAASIQLIFGLFLTGFGMVFGLSEWVLAAKHGDVSAPGTVMLAALPVLLGIQFLLAYFSHDIQSVPKNPIYPLLPELDNSNDIDKNQKIIGD